MTHFLIPAAQIFLAIALLLVAVMCVRLDAKLNALRKGKDGVAAAAERLLQAVARADAAIKSLRDHSDTATTALQQRIEEAQGVADGLKFLATTARALEPKATQARDAGWDDDDDFRPARREPPSISRWDSLR